MKKLTIIIDPDALSIQLGWIGKIIHPFILWTYMQSTGIYILWGLWLFSHVKSWSVSGREDHTGSGNISLINRVVCGLTSLEECYKISFYFYSLHEMVMFHFNDCNRILFLTLLVNYLISQEYGKIKTRVYWHNVLECK